MYDYNNNNMNDMNNTNGMNRQDTQSQQYQGSFSTLKCWDSYIRAQAVTWNSKATAPRYSTML